MDDTDHELEGSTVSVHDRVCRIRAATNDDSTFAPVREHLAGAAETVSDTRVKTIPVFRRIVGSRQGPRVMPTQTSGIADETDTSTLSDAIPSAHLLRVLVLKPGHLGDVLLASPVISALRRHSPQCEIDPLVYDDTAVMLSGHADLAQLFTIKRCQRGWYGGVRDEWQLLDGLRGRCHDLLVRLSSKPRVAWLARLNGVRYAVTADRPDWPAFWRKSFTHVYTVPRSNGRHAGELHLDALRRVGITPAPGERRLTLVPGEEAERRIDAILTEHGLQLRGFVHIHHGSRRLFKCWPAPRVASLINALHVHGQRFVLTGAPDPGEKALIAAVTSRLNQPANRVSGAPGVDLPLRWEANPPPAPFAIRVGVQDLHALANWIRYRRA